MKCVVLAYCSMCYWVKPEAARCHCVSCVQMALTDVVPSAVAAMDAHREVAEVAEIGLCLVQHLAAASDFQVMCAKVGTMWPCNQCAVSGSSLWSCGVFTTAAFRICEQLHEPLHVTCIGALS